MPQDSTAITPEIIEDWVKRLDVNPIEYPAIESIYDVIAVHTELHRVFGDSPSDAILPGERRLSESLRACGIEHRYQDALSRAAGTLVENPRPPSFAEINWFLKELTVHAGMVRFVSDCERSGIYVDVASGTLPENLQKATLRAIQRSMPYGVEALELDAGQQPPSDFARIAPSYDLVLTPRVGDILVQPWEQILASAPQSVLKEGRLRLNVKVAEKREGIIKSAQSLMESTERFVLGAALVPNEIDQQGHIYSEEEVRYACHWWAEHCGSFALGHVMLGGRPAEPGEIVMLENYVLPVACKVGAEEYPKGTWFVGAGVRSDAAWEEFASGKLNSWSIGAEAFATEEPVPN